MNYTKGPLIVKWGEMDGYDCMYGAFEILNAKGEIVAIVEGRFYGQESCDYSFLPPDEMKGNAALFAKAPAMYEALKSVQELFGEDDPAGVEVVEVPVSLLMLINSALEGL